ncbi:MAG: DEAD/DEAH box helicase family protein, partial [Devosia sp.]
MLRDLDLRRTYHKGRGKDDLAEDFYLPAVRASCVYDRAVGYFSSSIYLLAWPSLKQFVANGGRMRLLCSPVLSDQDEMAMRQGYSDLADEALSESLKRHFAELLSSPGMAKPAVVLASLVANGIIDCRIAWISPHAEGRATRIFHDKVGLLKDASGECVVFKGSMNETWPALSLDGNIESIDVYTSWRDAGERARVVDEEAYFEEVWAGRWPGVVVKPLPESARSEIISSANIAGWEGLVDDVCLELEDAAHWSADASRQGGRLPRPHQVLALEAWTAHGRRGILEHATGSGKTFTALCAINTSFQKGEIAIVAVPSELLLEQWEDELRSTFDGMGLELLMCGGGHEAWRSNALLRAWTRPRQAGSRPRAVLTTMQTAASSHFTALCSTGEHLFLVADEVHRLGAPESQRILSLNTGPRLGLSATPQRAGDPGGTQAIMDYFDGVVPPPYTLQDAIRDGTLTPYAYHPHAIEFDKPEQDEWTRITVQIRRAHARGHQDDGSWAPGAETRFKMMLINRARLAKGAHKKIETAVRVLSESYEPGQRWIIYCDDQSQLRDVVLALRGANVPDVFEYHSAMLGDRQGTLRLFESAGGIVVSIRCLDEGVDIPSVTHALILASSKNPREFIQRRGRVLRRYPGKVLAHVHDVLVTPSVGSDSPDDFDSMLRGELLRAIEFGTHAIN